MGDYAPIDAGAVTTVRRRSRVTLAAVGLAACGGLLGLLRSGASGLLVGSASLSSRSLEMSNPYERSQGRAIGDGLYPWKYMADVSQTTLFALSDGSECDWEVDGVALGSSRSIEQNLTTVGTHYVTSDCSLFDGTSDGSSVINVTVVSRVVRRELRELTREEREAYFGALFTVYAVSDVDGKRMYGDTYVSAAWLVRQHLYGAASKECDHWHDDAGIMNHHIGITWELENALRAVNPNVAAHYWDYTFDAKVYGSDWKSSPVFRDDWFGAIETTTNDKHIVDQGRWAFTKVLNARPISYSNQTNPYGLLRSPWNVNKVPFVMRSAYTFDSLGDGETTLPDCAEFEEYITSTASLGTILSGLNGALHGPVHLMIGGLWGNDNSTWGAISAKDGNVDWYLLAAKFMWRQGLTRCPTTCAVDVDVDDCRCYCPDSIRDLYGSSLGLLNASGVLDLWDQQHPTYALDNYNISYDELLDELCSVGLPGEMFTSAAPQDPTFWPLHGNAERYLQYMRLLDDAGLITLDATWSYDHIPEVASDTGIVCDWSNVQGMSLPTCVPDTCPGHKEDDLLEFSALFEGQSTLYTNREFYDLTAPGSESLPYVYNSLAHWPGCFDSTLNITQIDR